MLFSFILLWLPSSHHPVRETFQTCSFLWRSLPPGHCSNVTSSERSNRHKVLRPPGPTTQPQFHSSDILWAHKSRPYCGLLFMTHFCTGLLPHIKDKPSVSAEKGQKNTMPLYLQFMSHTIHRSLFRNLTMKHMGVF